VEFVELLTFVTYFPFGHSVLRRAMKHNGNCKLGQYAYRLDAFIVNRPSLMNQDVISVFPWSCRSI